MDVKEIKSEVRAILREKGFKKMHFSEYLEKDYPKNFYCVYDGAIFFHLGEICYAFGVDNLMRCTAHICGNGNDCCTSAERLFPTFEKHASGEISDADVISEWLSD